MQENELSVALVLCFLTLAEGYDNLATALDDVGMYGSAHDARLKAKFYKARADIEETKRQKGKPRNEPVD